MTTHEKVLLLLVPVTVVVAGLFLKWSTTEPKPFRPKDDGRVYADIYTNITLLSHPDAVQIINVVLCDYFTETNEFSCLPNPLGTVLIGKHQLPHDTVPVVDGVNFKVVQEKGCSDTSIRPTRTEDIGLRFESDIETTGTNEVRVSFTSLRYCGHDDKDNQPLVVWQPHRYTLQKVDKTWHIVWRDADGLLRWSTQPPAS